MSKKPGRNKPCPCGSGKKYKWCCIGRVLDKILPKSSKLKTMSEVEKYINTHDRIDLLKTNAALQLIPTNHGKNVRFEIMGKEIINRSKNGLPRVSYPSLTSFFNNNFKSHYLEDPLDSFFTENVIWFYGDFTVFPGLNHNGTRILNFFLETIFTQENKLPEKFKIEVRDATMLILAMGESMALSAGLKRYEFEEADESAISLPPEIRLNHLKDAVTFDKAYLEKVAEHYGVNANAIHHFVLDPNDPELVNDDPDANPLLNFPIVKNGNDEFIFSLPTVIVNCLLHFIRNQAGIHGCYEELMNQYYNHQWSVTRSLLQETGWRETDISLPKTELDIQESVFRIDNDKLAYACFIMQKVKNNNEMGVEEAQESDHINNPFEERTSQVIEFLERLNGNHPYRYLALNVIGESGQDSFFMLGKPTNNNQKLSLQFGELEKLVFSDELDSLTLWKFAKVYSHTQARMAIFSMGGVLDAFVSYQANSESLMPPDAAAPDIMHYAVGSAGDFERRATKRQDEHSTLQYTEKYGLLPVPVRRLREFAPIYKEREYSKNHNILLEGFGCPVWVKNDQARSSQQKEIINHYCEAVIFWLYKMRKKLNFFFSPFTHQSPIEFQLILTDALLNPSAIPERSNEGINLNIEIETSKEENTISIRVPNEILSLLFRSDNLGEKELMRSVLNGFSKLLQQKGLDHLNEELISDLVNDHLNPDSAKMILYFDTANEYRLDNRWLVPYREIQESEISIILDELVSYLSLDQPIPEKIQSKQEKNILCNQVVSTLIDRVGSKLIKYDAGELLKWLMPMHEKCIHYREFQELHIPAKISCFSDIPTEVSKLDKGRGKLDQTSLSLRCLIEFIVAKPSFGGKWPNIDDFDELLALMSQIISWGILSDSIRLEMDDPEIGLLPSGRIGTEKSFAENYMKPFSKEKAETAVHEYQEAFTMKFDNPKVKDQEELEINPEVEEIDAAFEDEWNISLTNLLKLKGTLVQIAFDQEKSNVEIEESELMTTLEQLLPEMNHDDLRVGMRLITFKARESISKSPKDFEKDDIYPWKYNRSLSYLRKPMLNIKKPDGKSMYYWSFRHVIDSGENVRALLFSGRLKAKKGGVLSSYLKVINKEKGKEFRDQVTQWLTNEGSLKVIPHEVKPSKLSGDADDDKYGDVDILAIDEAVKVVYSIECKNTVPARVIHEMKTEMDKYLGRDEKEGTIIKHVRRDEWLKGNIDLLDEFISKPWEYSIVSLLITSEVIPLVYLARERIALPIIAFPVLRRRGISLITDITD